MPTEGVTIRQVRAARALLGWSRGDLAQASGVPEANQRQVESAASDMAWPDATAESICAALENAGVVFIADNGGGVGVRLKFNRRETRAIDKLENEGGIVRDDDVR